MTRRPKQVRQKARGSAEKRAKSSKISFAERFVKQAKSPVLKKEAVTTPFQSRMKKRMAWSDEQADLEDSWSWGQPRDWRGKVWDSILMPFLEEVVEKDWAEIEGERSGKDKRHKTYPQEAICKEAQDRLVYLELDDMETIFRFRITSKQRFYGFLVQHIFYALWWDAEHKICPTDLQDRGKVRKRRK